MHRLRVTYSVYVRLCEFTRTRSIFWCDGVNTHIGINATEFTAACVQEIMDFVSLRNDESPVVCKLETPLNLP